MKMEKFYFYLILAVILFIILKTSTEKLDYQSMAEVVKGFEGVLIELAK